MRLVVKKYQVEPRTCVEFDLPYGARILKLSVLEDGLPYLLVLQDADLASTSRRHIRFYETDEPVLEKDLEYLGSILSTDGAGAPMQLHCFEVTRIVL